MFFLARLLSLPFSAPSEEETLLLVASRFRFVVPSVLPFVVSGGFTSPAMVTEESDEARVFSCALDKTLTLVGVGSWSESESDSSVVATALLSLLDCALVSSAASEDSLSLEESDDELP